MQNAILLHCLFLFIENVTFPPSISFLINMEGSKRTTTCIGHLYSSTKKQAKKQKRYNLMTESLMSNNTSNRFKFIMAPTREKITVDNMLLQPVPSEPEKWVGFYWQSGWMCNVWSKYLLFTTSYKTTDCLLTRIKFHWWWFGKLWHFLRWWFNSKSWLWWWLAAWRTPFWRHNLGHFGLITNPKCEKLKIMQNGQNWLPPGFQIYDVIKNWLASFFQGQDQGQK